VLARPSLWPSHPMMWAPRTPTDLAPIICRCAIATREKTTIFYSRIIVLLILHTLLNAIICCLQLNTQRLFGWYPENGLLVIDAVGLQSIYYIVMPQWIS
jgi:hypothetical protein